MKSCLKIGVLVTFSLAAIAAAAPTIASDYAHTCRSADGTYEMNDEALYKTGSDGSSGREIPYTKLRETILKRETGYCITKTGNRYEFEFKSYTVRVAFKDDGNTFEFDMVCELASDGLPTAEVCSKTVVTSSTGGGASPSGGQPETGADKAAPGTQGWMHNGSTMKLIASGNKRRFAYVVPRAGLASAGIKPGDTVFEGTRDGSTYSGTAYIFKAGCDPQGYPVSGFVSGDERSVTMTGQRPVVSKSCRVENYKDDTLVFELPGDSADEEDEGD